MRDDPIHLRFGPGGRFELDEALFELRDGGEPIPLEPKPFGLLLFLARHRDRVVRREELFETLWPGIVISDHALSRAVFKVRKALGEEGQPDGSIQTLRGAGLRFVAETFEDPRREPAASPPGPSPRGSNPDRLIGRESERVQLSSAFAAALAGRGGLVLVEGEPGIGKTRLAQAIAAEAEDAGAFVHWARAHREAGAPSLWLWRQILRGLFEAEGPERIERSLGAEARELARVLPDLPLTPDARPEEGLPEDARFRFQEALAQLVLRAAREEVRVLVLEDLQWADRSSLRGLAHVVSAIGASRVLIVATARVSSPGDATFQAIGDVAAEASRSSQLRRILLEPLDGPSVAKLFEARSGLHPSQEFIGRLADRTGGNPYFVSQLGDAAAEGPGGEARLDSLLDETPAGLHAALRQRLEELSSGCREALSYGALIGRDFPVAWVARASRQERKGLVASFGEAVRARVIERGEGEFSYRFCHDLQREVIASELVEGDRVERHLRLGEAIHDLNTARLDTVMTTLAYHFGEAAPLVEGMRAVEFAKRAGELAREAYAFDEAAAYFRQALELLAWVEESPAALAAELLVGEGFALQGAGRHREGHAILDEAAKVARAAGSPTLFAVAVMGSTELGAISSDPDRVERLHEALGGLEQDAGAVRVWLTAHLALHESQAGELERARELAEQCAEAARVGPKAWQSMALSAKVAVSRLRREVLPGERLRGLDEAVALARSGRAPSFELFAALQRFGALMELARRDEAESERDNIARLIQKTGSRYFRYVPPSLAAGLRLLDGELDEAERLTQEAFGDEEGPRFAAAGQIGMIATTRYQQGRLAELLPALDQIVDSLPDFPAVRGAEVLALLEGGQTRRAEARFAALGSDAFEGIVGRESWVFTLCLLAEACSILEDRKRAEPLSMHLAPRSEHVAILAHGHYVHGPVALFLALLDHCREDWDAMHGHLEQAARVGEGLRSPIWRASTLATEASLALGTGDEPRALELARESFAHAEVLGLAFTRLRESALEVAQR